MKAEPTSEQRMAERDHPERVGVAGEWFWNLVDGELSLVVVLPSLGGGGEVEGETPLLKGDFQFEVAVLVADDPGYFHAIIIDYTTLNHEHINNRAINSDV